MSRMSRRDPPATESVDDVDELARLIMSWIHLSMQRNSMQPNSATCSDSGESARVEMDAGLTMPQHQTLHMLMYEGSCSVSTLTKKLGMSVSAVSHLAQRLVEMGFVAREEDPHDRRQKTLSLAPAGKKLVERLMKARFKEMRGSVEHLSAPLKRELKNVLERIVTEMGAQASKQHEIRSDRKPEDT
jgi:DNA-binding MarR family transcriptional regulator